MSTIEAVSALTRSIREIERLATAIENDGQADAFAPVQKFAEVVEVLEGIGLSPIETDATALSVSQGLAILPHRDRAGRRQVFDAMLFSDTSDATEPWMFVGPRGIVPLAGHLHTEVVLDGTKHMHGTPATEMEDLCHRHKAGEHNLSFPFHIPLSACEQSGN